MRHWLDYEDWLDAGGAEDPIAITVIGLACSVVFFVVWEHSAKTGRNQTRWNLFSAIWGIATMIGAMFVHDEYPLNSGLGVGLLATVAGVAVSLVPLATLALLNDLNGRPSDRH